MKDKERLMNATGWTFRRLILICSIILFGLGFWLLIIGNKIWMIMHITGFIGLGWSLLLREVYEKEIGEEKQDDN